MFGFEYRFDTQFVLCIVSRYRLILDKFYVTFQVSFDTQFVLCIVSRYRLILDKFYVTFLGCHLGVFMVIVYKAPVSLTSVFKALLFSGLREGRLRQTEYSIYLVEQLPLQFASRIH